MSNFDLSALALSSVCPSNELLHDDLGMPSVMVKIPKMTYAQMGLGTSTAVHPAFIVNGQEIDAIWIGKYQSIVQNGRAYSLPGQDPRASITFDTAKSYCTAKGVGWHIMTMAEWAMVAWWCKNNETLPKGNNNYGKDHADSSYKAIPTYYDGTNICRVATGTGPLSWSHNGEPDGIWDLNGNVREWVGGFRTVYGEVQVLANNNAANWDADQSESSGEWMAIDGTTGELITPNGSGTTSGSIKMDYISSKWVYTTGTLTSQEDSSRSCSFKSVTYDSTIAAAAQFVLQALGMLPYGDCDDIDDTMYRNNGQAERLCLCGGYWDNGSNAGVFYSYGYYSRTLSSATLGFRLAFCELTAD